VMEDRSPTSGPQALEVVVLTQDSCDLCDRAKTLLEGLRAEYALDIRTRDLASPEGRALAERGGVLFPPGVFIGGEPFSYGRLSERKLRKELDRRRARR
jgi:glutaredoxin